jgi:hypothetical protein
MSLWSPWSARKAALRKPGQRRPASRARRPAGATPRLEALEERLAPATNVWYDDTASVAGLDPAGNLYVSGNVAFTADARGTAAAHSWLQGPARFLAEYNSSGAVVWARRFTELFGADGGIGGVAVFTDSVSGQTSLYVSRSNYTTSTFWVSKLAADGTVLWNMQTGMAGHIAVDATGAAYVEGSFSGSADFDPQQPGQHVLTANGQDAFLLKVDASGNFQWVDQLGGAGTQWGSGVTVQGGTVYATGMFSQTFAPAGFTDQGAVGVSQSADGYLVKYDTNGVFQAGYQFVDAQVGAVVVDGTGAVYVPAGFGLTADLNPDPNAQYLVDPANGGAAFVKLNADGTFAWARQLSVGISGFALGGSSLYLGGTFSGTVDFDPGPGQYSLTAAGGQDAFTAQYTTDGNFVWAQRMGSSSSYGVTPAEGAGSLAVSANALYAGGFFNPGPATFGPFTLTGYADYDGFVTRQDLAGNFQWAFQVESLVRTVDDGDPGYSETGSGWKANTSGGFQGDSRYHTKGSGADKATWTFSGLPAGTYQVQATWKPASTNASNAPYSVNGGTPVLVNQQVAPNDILSDAYTTFWKVLGTYTVGSGGTLTVQLSDAANGRVVADGIRVVFQTPAAGLLAAGGPAATSLTAPAPTGQGVRPLLRRVAVLAPPGSAGGAATQPAPFGSGRTAEAPLAAEAPAVIDRLFSEERPLLAAWSEVVFVLLQSSGRGQAPAAPLALA